MSVAILFIGVGFLLAVLWIDLIFDSMVAPYRSSKELPDEVLAAIASFFRRITYNPFVLFAVMFVVLVIVILQIAQNSVPAWLAWISLIVFVAPTAYAGIVIVPAANRLGSRVDSIEKQSELARSIYSMHIFSFVMMLLFGALQLYAVLVH